MPAPFLVLTVPIVSFAIHRDLPMNLVVCQGPFGPGGALCKDLDLQRRCGTTDFFQGTPCFRQCQDRCGHRGARSRPVVCSSYFLARDGERRRGRAPTVTKRVKCCPKNVAATQVW